YALTATASGLTAISSASFNVTSGVATGLVFTVQPVTTVADRQITPAVKVTALDALGNPVPSFTGSVTVALVAGTGAVLGGTAVVPAVNGVATCGTLFIDKSGTGY